MSGHLCLKWNNHSSAFLKGINNIHAKEQYCDATLACQGKFFPVHRFILSTCSDYFSEIFERMQCPHPYIVFKDIESHEMELLLNYMYQGEVNVVQERLPTLIKAAEALQIKGLAVPDDVPAGKEGSSKKRSATTCGETPSSKRRLEERRRKGDSSSAEAAMSTGDPTTSSSHRSQDDELRMIKEEPLDPLGDDFASDEPPPIIKTEFDAGNLAGDSSMMEKEENVFNYSIDESAAFSKTDDHFEDDQSSSWGDYPSGSMMQGLPPSEAAPQDDMYSGLGRSDNARFGSPSELPSTQSGKGSPLRLPPGVSIIRNPLNQAFACPFCSHECSRMGSLKEHIMSRHTGERPFTCTVCSKRFGRERYLRAHMRVHTGEKPFQCRNCSNRFSFSSALTRHAIHCHSFY